MSFRFWDLSEELEIENVDVEYLQGSGVFNQQGSAYMALFGKSEEMLSNAIKSNINFDNICIYLDAHLCRDHLTNKKTFGDEDSGTPIKLELNLIQNYLNNFKKLNILIDDIRLFNNKFQNYPNKNYIIEWCNKNNLSWEIEQDIFICKKY